MNNELKTLFYLKKPKNYQGGPIPIYLRITLESPPSEISIGKKCFPEDWDSKNERIIEGASNASLINPILRKNQLKVVDTFRYLTEMESETKLTAQRLKESIAGKIEKPKSLFDVFKEHNEKMSMLIGIEYAKGTWERYETVLSHTAEFIKYKYKAADIILKHLDHEFISEFDFYLRTVRLCSNNTTVKYLMNFKKIVLICLSRGLMATNPYLNYRGKHKKKKKGELSPSEIISLERKKFKIERLSQVRDVFIFSCYTGLSYIDVYNLRPSDIKVGIDGELWVDKPRKKTGINFLIPLLPKAISILEKYKGHPQCVNRGKCLPISSNQKMNAYLQEIEDICCLPSRLNFGKSRHTFATTIALSNDVPIETVSRMMGHTNIRTTQIYARVVDKKISIDMKKLKTKLLPENRSL